jgi:hypothetical protein
MEASVLDLRYRMREVLDALNRREKVQIKYHGKIKGEIVPRGTGGKHRSSEHPLFGMMKDEKGDPARIVADMRRSRYRDL